MLQQVSIFNMWIIINKQKIYKENIRLKLTPNDLKNCLTVLFLKLDRLYPASPNAFFDAHDSIHISKIKFRLERLH